MLAKMDRSLLSCAVVLALLQYGRCQNTSGFSVAPQTSQNTNTPSTLYVGSSSANTLTTSAPVGTRTSSTDGGVGLAQRMLKINPQASTPLQSTSGFVQTLGPTLNGGLLLNQGQPTQQQPSIPVLTQLPGQINGQNPFSQGQNLPFPAEQIAGNNGGPCFVTCQQMPSGTATVSQYLSPQQLLPLERVVLYLYAVPDPQNPQVKRYFLYVPGAEKQNVLPDLPLHTVDILTEVETLNVPAFMPSNPAVIARPFFSHVPNYVQPTVPLVPIPFPPANNYLPRVVNLPQPQKQLVLVPGQVQSLPQPAQQPSDPVLFPSHQPSQSELVLLPGQQQPQNQFVITPDQQQPQNEFVLVPGQQQPETVLVPNQQKQVVPLPAQQVVFPSQPHYRPQGPYGLTSQPSESGPANLVYPYAPQATQVPGQQYYVYPTPQPQSNVTPRNPFLEFIRQPNLLSNVPQQSQVFLQPGQLAPQQYRSNPYYFPSNNNVPRPYYYGPGNVPSLPQVVLPSQVYPRQVPDQPLPYSQSGPTQPSFIEFANPTLPTNPYYPGQQNPNILINKITDIVHTTRVPQLEVIGIYPGGQHPSGQFDPRLNPNGLYPYNLHPNQQYPNQQYPNQQYPNQQYPNQQYPNQQYPNQQYPNQQYPNQLYPNQQYPNVLYTGGRYPNDPNLYGLYPNNQNPYGQQPYNGQSPFSNDKNPMHNDPNTPGRPFSNGGSPLQPLNFIPFEKWVFQYLTSLSDPTNRPSNSLIGDYPVDLNSLKSLLSLNGKPFDPRNLKLLPIMIGTSAIQDDLLPLLSKDKQLLRNMPFVEALAVTTLNPPGIIGILPLGLTSPKTKQVGGVNNQDWISLNPNQLNGPNQPPYESGSQQFPTNLLDILGGRVTLPNQNSYSEQSQPGQGSLLSPQSPASYFNPLGKLTNSLNSGLFQPANVISTSPVNGYVESPQSGNGLEFSTSLTSPQTGTPGSLTLLGGQPQSPSGLVQLPQSGFAPQSQNALTFQGGLPNQQFDPQLQLQNQQGGLLAQGGAGSQFLTQGGFPPLNLPGLGPLYQSQFFPGQTQGLSQTFSPYQNVFSVGPMDTRILKTKKKDLGNAADPQYRIIGGSPATGSGAPLSNKGRSGPLV